MLSEQNNLKIQEKSIESVSKQIEDLQNQIEAEKEKFKNLRGEDLKRAMLELNEQVNRAEYTHCETCKENCRDPCGCCRFFTWRCTIYPIFGSDCEKCGHQKNKHSRDKLDIFWIY